MYELTSFLETIAAASATIIAILGGLIAGRLISLNSERTSAIERIKQISEELKLHKAECDSLQKDNDDDDALDFVDDHIEDLISNTDLSDLYDESELPALSKDKLSPYWETAKDILSQYFSVTMDENCQFNSDHIPAVIAQQYAGDTFGYGVCQLIGVEVEKAEEEREREEQRKNNSFMAAMQYPDLSIPSRVAVSNRQYLKNLEVIAEHNSAIKFLELEKQQLNNHINALRSPKGIKWSLGIFISFAVLCIICPLLVTPFSTENLFCFRVVKFVFLVLFLVELVTIFFYLVYLLKWDEKTKL